MLHTAYCVRPVTGLDPARIMELRTESDTAVIHTR